MQSNIYKVLTRVQIGLANLTRQKKSRLSELSVYVVCKEWLFLLSSFIIFFDF